MTTVIIPAYNVAPYLRKCIRSIMMQPRWDFECIIVDDGSTDGTGDLAEELTAKDPRFKVIHQPNGGISAARNRAMEIARGDYLLFVDADDWIEYDTLDHLRVVAKYHPSAGRICGQQLVHSRGGRWLWGLPPAGMLWPDDPSVFADANNDLGHATGCLYIRERIPDGLSFPQVKIFEDMLFNMGLFFAGVPAYISPKIVYHYETRPNSILSCDYTEDDAAKARKVLEDLRNRFNPQFELYRRCRLFLERALRGKLNQNFK